MKKGMGLIIVGCIALMLAACGSKEVEERLFEIEEMGIVTTMTYTYQGDEVLTQKAESTIPYISLGITSKEEAEEMLTPDEDVQEIDGVTEEITYKDEEAVEVLEIDYEHLDTDRLDDIPGLQISGDIEHGISMDKSGEMLIQQGYEEIE